MAAPDDVLRVNDGLSAALQKERASNAALRTALGYARGKLQFYRLQHSGEYVGGVEYVALMKIIDAALKKE